ncbi:MAG: response regulator [Verrucomicrobiaceae bacterium]
MNADPTYQQHAILFIDDEVQSQKYFSQIFSKIFKVYVASDGEEGLKLFEEHQDTIGVVVSDQRMPGMSGSEVLAAIAQQKPDAVKILSTAYSDLDAAIDAVNEGGIYRYVTKPWDLAELEVTLRRAMDFYQLKEQNRSLAQMKISGLEQMYHQSRLLACIAIPTLLENQPSTIRAFRDLLRLSLQQEDSFPDARLNNIEGLTRQGRLELAEKVRNRLQSLLAAATKPADIAKVEASLSELGADGKRPLLVDALQNLLKGEDDQAGSECLAHLLSAYTSGYEIRREGKEWKLIKTDPAAVAASSFEELYSLFVDDAFLVSVALGELG